MSSRIPLQTITNISSNYSSMMYEPYCHCCYYENSSTFYTENCYQTNEMNIPIESKKKSSSPSTRRSKHIPHHLRPQHIVERRNRRERLRVQDVNQAFHMLQQLLPFETNSTVASNDAKNQSRISKVRTLRTAVDYIEALQRMLQETQ